VHNDKGMWNNSVSEIVLMTGSCQSVQVLVVLCLFMGIDFFQLLVVLGEVK
jgi:hypothetical protein